MKGFTFEKTISLFELIYQMNNFIKNVFWNDVAELSNNFEYYLFLIWHHLWCNLLNTTPYQEQFCTFKKWKFENLKKVTWYFFLSYEITFDACIVFNVNTFFFCICLQIHCCYRKSGIVKNYQWCIVLFNYSNVNNICLLSILF